MRQTMMKRYRIKVISPRTGNEIEYDYAAEDWPRAKERVLRENPGVRILNVVRVDLIPKRDDNN